MDGIRRNNLVIEWGGTRIILSNPCRYIQQVNGINQCTLEAVCR